MTAGRTASDTLSRCAVGPLSGWQAVLLFCSTLAIVTSTVRVLWGVAQPTVGVDAALFEHAGWYVTQGAVPYRDIWDTKPPLVYATTTAIALLSGGDLYLLHLLGVAASGVAAIASVLLMGQLVADWTGDGAAAVVAGVVPLGLAAFHYSVTFGFRPKYPALAFGLAALVLFTRERPVAAGAAAAVAGGFIQQAALVFLIVFVGSFVRSRRDAAFTIVGAGAVTVTAVAPVVAAGAGVPMLTEVVVVQLLVSEPIGPKILAEKAGRGLLQAKYGLLVFVIGAYATARLVIDRSAEAWWVVAGAGGYGLLLLVDWDGASDLFFLLAFLSVAVGFVFNRLDAWPRRVVVMLVLAAALVSAAALGGAGVLFNPANDDLNFEEEPDVLARQALHDARVALVGPYSPAEAASTAPPVSSRYYRANDAEAVLNRIYWGRIEPRSCHYRFSNAELRWIKRMGRSASATQCGAWPD